MKLDSNNHSVFLLHYHLIFVIKFCRKVIDDAVCIEDLNMKSMSQALKFGKSVSDNSWGMFTAYLNYKLQELEKQFVKIDKWLTSLKTCSCCGAVKQSI